MGFLGFGKKRDVVDLTEHYKKQQEKLASQKQEGSQSSISSAQTGAGTGFSVFDNLEGASSSSSSAEQEEYPELGGSIEDRRKKLAKRLMDMTDKLEDLNNQLYHLQQRIELIEKKVGLK